MPPLRLAIVGLSSTAKTSWASNAHLPYLLSPRGRARFTIVALLNSSVAAARAAIAAYGLDPATTKAYGTPEALAADPDVDFVVVNTRVDVHVSSVAPSVRAGKKVWVEWPLAEGSEAARGLVGLVAGERKDTVVGLQGRVAGLVERVRGLVDGGRVGKVLSSDVRIYGGTNDRAVLPAGLEYFSKREIGGNQYTIGFAHSEFSHIRKKHEVVLTEAVFDTVQHVLGDILKDPVTGKATGGHFQVQRPEVPIVGSDGKVSHTNKTDVPDLVHVTGTLPESAAVQKGATLHISLRRGQPYPGDPAFVWTINGEKGEIRVVSQVVSFIQVGSDDHPATLEVHDFETDKVEKVEWEYEEWQKELPVAARNVGSLYEAFAAAQEGGEVQYATFEDAYQRHKQLDELLEGFQG